MEARKCQRPFRVLCMEQEALGFWVIHDRVSNGLARAVGVGGRGQDLEFDSLPVKLWLDIPDTER